MTEAHYTVTHLDTVRPTKVQWLMPDRIPYGAITIVAGLPGEGKSQFTCWLAAEASKKDTTTLMVGVEDGLEDAVVPRLLAQGADLTKIKALDMESGVLLPTDAPMIRAAARDEGASILIIDPILSHLSPELSANDAQGVRLALKPLAMMARESGMAVIVVTHPPKSREGDPMNRIGGSLGGFPGIARSAFLLGRRRQDDLFEQAEWRYLVHVKANTKKMPTLSMRMAEVPVAFDGRVIGTSALTPYETRAEVEAEDIA